MNANEDRTTTKEKLHMYKIAYRCYLIISIIHIISCSALVMISIGGIGTLWVNILEFVYSLGMLMFFSIKTADALGEYSGLKAVQQKHNLENGDNLEHIKEDNKDD